MERGTHAYDGATAAEEEEKEESEVRERKTGGKARRLQGIKKRCLHTSAIPRSLVLEAAQGWAVLGSRF